MAKWHFDEDAEEFKGDELYFIQQGSDGPIKVGRGNAASRVLSLQTGNPQRLVILGTMANAGYTEAFWHAAFAATRLLGEWFIPSPELLEAISWALKGEPWADDAPAPAEVDDEQFPEAMLDAFDWYQDLVFDGVSERAAATRAMNYAFANSLPFELKRDLGWLDEEVDSEIARLSPSPLQEQTA